MPSRLNAALSPAAMLIAILALVVSAAGAGYAAATIGTKDIKNNAITAKKIKKNAVTAKKIKKDAVNSAKVANGSLVSADLADGTVGRNDLAPAADKLLQGAPWETLPSGVTVTGHFYEASTAAAGTKVVFGFDLPGHAPAALTNGTVNFSSDAYPASVDDDESCAGTYAAPEAPPGKVCLYLGSALGGSSMRGYAWGGSTHAKQAFWVETTVGPGAPYDIYGVWAYTAP